MTAHGPANASAETPRTVTTAGRGAPVMIVDDGTQGGIHRAVEYLVTGLEHRDAERRPVIERLSLRGAGRLRASAPVFARAVLRTVVRLAWRRPRLFHVNFTQRGSTWRALVIVALARAGRVPVFLHLHSSEYAAFTAGLPPVALAVVRWMFARAACVAVLGDSWAEYARRELRVQAERVVVVPNAVPGPVQAPRPRKAGPLRLLFLGEVGPRKGAGDLIEALGRPEVARLEWTATFAGDGDLGRYRDQAARLGLSDRVRFTGWLPRSEAYRELEAADVLVLPSYAEGMPLSVLEGLAHGLAVVTTPVGAIGEVIEDGENGMLVPPGDVPALGAALHALVTQPSLRERLAQHGRARWERDHDVAVYAERIVTLYDAIAPIAAR